MRERESATAEQEAAKSLMADLSLSIAKDYAAVVMSPAVVANENGTILFANEAVTRDLGWGGELLYKNLHDTLIPERFREAHDAAITKLKETNQPTILLRELPLAAMRADGTEVPVLIQINARPIDEGRWLFFGNIVPTPEKPQSALSKILGWLRG